MPFGDAGIVDGLSAADKPHRPSTAFLLPAIQCSYLPRLRSTSPTTAEAENAFGQPA